MLQRLARDIGWRDNLQVYVMGFHVPQHTIPPQKEPDASLMTILRVLQVCPSLNTFPVANRFPEGQLPLHIPWPARYCSPSIFW
jgi:hypothetical protein